ncbi:MAG: YlbF family regulator [bacterium]|nr:YlbF family regulator [bacterium]
MIDKLTDKLFTSIKQSSEYKNYLKARKKVDNNMHIISLLTTIKKMQQEATKKEYKKDIGYKIIDKEINKLKEELDNNVLYQDYLTKKEELNNMLSMIVDIINKYVEDIV